MIPYLVWDNTLEFNRRFDYRVIAMIITNTEILLLDSLTEYLYPLSSLWAIDEFYENMDDDEYFFFEGEDEEPQLKRLVIIIRLINWL